MKKVILTTAVLTVLSGVSLLAKTVNEDNYENYNTGGNKVKFASTKKLIDVHDLLNSKSSIYEEVKVSKTVIYNFKSDTYNN